MKTNVGAVLACTDNAVLPVSVVFDAIRELDNQGAQHYDPLLITSASSLNNLPVESSSMDIVILIWRSLDCPTFQLVQEILRVLKVGGTTLIRKPYQSDADSINKIVSDLEHKLLFAGFTETQVLLSKSTISSEAIPSDCHIMCQCCNLLILMH